MFVDLIVGALIDTQTQIHTYIHTILIEEFTNRAKISYIHSQKFRNELIKCIN